MRDTGRFKQFRKAIAQLDEEGVVQVLRDPDLGDQAPMLAPLSVNGLKLLRLLQRAPFAEVARIKPSGMLAGEIEDCLAQQIHFVLDRDVRSARFVETLRRPRSS